MSELLPSQPRSRLPASTTQRVGGVPRLRLSVIGVAALSLFASLFARLYDLQIVSSPEYQVQAEANRVRVVQIPAPRGRILDRHGKVLVDNRVAVVVAVDRNAFDDLDGPDQATLLERLSAELTRAGHPMTPDQIRTRLGDQRFSRYAPVPIAHDVPEELKIFLEEHADDFPTVEVERTAVRRYPYGPLGAHVLGYVGKINDEELAAHEDEVLKPYALNDDIGKTGVEQTYESVLRGRPGIRRIEVDAEGDPVRVISGRLPERGDDLVLTIDIDVQALAERTLQQGLADARARPVREGNPPNRGSTGAVVVEDPNNGQILAMASYPTYNPTQFVDGIDAGEWARLNDPVNHYPLNNWAIQGQWAPGSNYKLFVGYAALQSGLMAADTVFYDQGGYQIPGCTGEKCYRVNAGGASYGAITIDRAMTISSDAFFYNVGAQFWLQQERLGGEEGLQQYLRGWGIGDETGVPLFGEVPGRVPTPAWKREHCAQVNCGDPEWRTGDNVNMGVGQGDVLVTPLQLANGYATFANGGTRYVPQIALRVEQADTGQPVIEIPAEAAGRVELPPHVRQPLLDGLVGVTRNGTAARAFAGFPHDAFPVAGKTGTAQVDNKADTAVFSAFGPAPAPRFQVTAILEESGFGGTAAAPVVRALFDALAGVEPLPPAPARGVFTTPSEPLAPATGGAYD